MTGDDLCNVGRCLADLAKEETSSDEAKGWSLMKCMQEYASRYLWPTPEEKASVLERWRSLQMLRKDADVLCESAGEAVEKALLGRCSDEELRSLFEDLTNRAKSLRKDKKERDKEEQREKVRKNIGQVRSFVNNVLIEGGGLSLMTMEKIFKEGDLKKTLLFDTSSSEGENVLAPSTQVDEDWRAWRALEQIVGFTASARKADQVEERMKELMHFSTDMQTSEGGEAKVVLEMVVEELTKAGGNAEGVSDFVVFENLEAARKALAKTQLIYFCRSLWLGIRVLELLYCAFSGSLCSSHRCIIHTQDQTKSHTYIYTPTHTYIQLHHIQTYILAHTHIHTYIHT
jgi:hypothetical protein